MQKIKFKNQDFILMGDKEMGGSIATEHQYQNFEESFAYLTNDGRVLRYRQQIGTVDDIEFGEECNIEPSDEAQDKAVDWLFGMMGWQD